MARSALPAQTVRKAASGKAALTNAQITRHRPVPMNTLRFWSRKITDKPSTTSNSPRIGRVSRMWNCTAMEPKSPASGRLSRSRSFVVAAKVNHWRLRVSTSKSTSVVCRK